MTSVSEFHGYGKVFSFEPPVNMGNHLPDSLGKIAAIALMGAEASTSLLAMGEQQTDMAITRTHGEPEMLAVVLNSMLDGKHRVTVS